MAEVDANDDTIRRFVVHHYAFDKERRERRHQVVAAFDNHTELVALIETLSQDLRDRQADGLADAREHYSGVVLEPGHAARANQSRIWRKYIQKRARASSRQRK